MQTPLVASVAIQEKSALGISAVLLTRQRFAMESAAPAPALREESVAHLRAMCVAMTVALPLTSAATDSAAELTSNVIRRLEYARIRLHRRRPVAHPGLRPAVSLTTLG